MEIVDIAMTGGFLVIPPLLILLVKNRLRGFVYSVVTLWLFLIVGGQYHLAYTPEYDSVGPGLSIVAGWLPALAYSGIWFGIAMLFAPTPDAAKKIENRAS